DPAGHRPARRPGGADLWPALRRRAARPAPGRKSASAGQRAERAPPEPWRANCQMSTLAAARAALRHDLSLARREIREGRFQRSMALIAAFSAVVSGWEAYAQHLRRAFSHWLMWTPVWLAPPTVLAAIG